MELQREIDKLLANGFFTTRAKSPIRSPMRDHFYQTYSHSRVPPQSYRRYETPPPRPLVEDEIVSLSRESDPPIPCYDPPNRGIIDQNPIILEADIDEAEFERMQKIPLSEEEKIRGRHIPPKEATTPEEERLHSRRGPARKPTPEEVRVRDRYGAAKKVTQEEERARSRHGTAKKVTLEEERARSRHGPAKKVTLEEERARSRYGPAKEVTLEEERARSRHGPAKEVSLEEERVRGRHGPAKDFALEEERIRGRRGPEKEVILEEERVRGRRGPEKEVALEEERVRGRYGPAREFSQAEEMVRGPHGQVKEAAPELQSEDSQDSSYNTAQFHSRPQKSNFQEKPSRPNFIRKKSVPQRARSQLRRSPRSHTTTPRVIPISRAPSFEYLPSCESNCDAYCDHFHDNSRYHKRHPNRQHYSEDSEDGRPIRKGRGRANSASPPSTPGSDPYFYGGFREAPKNRLRNEKPTRHTLAPVEPSDYRPDRHMSTHSVRFAHDLETDAKTGAPVNGSRSPRKRIDTQGSSEDDYEYDVDSDDRRSPMRFTRRKYLTKDPVRYRSSSRNSKSSSRNRRISRLNSPTSSPKILPNQVAVLDHFGRPEIFQRSRDMRISNPRQISPYSADREVYRAEKAKPSGFSNVQQLIPTRHSTPPQIYWQRSPFYPENVNHQDQPMSMLRRFSEKIELGIIPSLPSCPRKKFVKGKNDWVTLPNCVNFDICPSCFEKSIAPTKFRHCFVPSQHRDPELEILCDFGTSPWYRIAWLIMTTENHRTIDLLYTLASMSTTVSPCSRDRESRRQWFSIVDPWNGMAIKGFDICLSCVRSVEILLPALSGIFVFVEPFNSPLRSCNLRYSSKRFVQYFDAMETIAAKAIYEGHPPDIRPLARLARHLTLFEECQEDIELLDHRWHVINQLPEFTVCEECFDQVIHPLINEGKAIALMFTNGTKRLGRASCQLYSRRMREMFRNAVATDDYQMLASKAHERKSMELVFKARATELKQQNLCWDVTEDVKRLVEDWKVWE